MRIGFNNEMTKGFVAVKGADDMTCTIPECAELSVKSFDACTVFPVRLNQNGKEYLYVISGKVEFMDVNTKETYEFHGGDFCTIHPGTAYAQKTTRGTKLLEIRERTLEEKETLPDSDVLCWMKKGRLHSREDLSYFYK